MPTNWAIQNRGFGPLAAFDVSFRTRVMSELLHNVKWFFNDARFLLGFLGDVEKHYGSWVLECVRKLHYTVDFLDKDSIDGVRELAKMLVSPSAFAIEMQESKVCNVAEMKSCLS